MVGLSCLKKVRGEARSKHEEQARLGQVPTIADGKGRSVVVRGSQLGLAGLGGAV